MNSFWTVVGFTLRNKFKTKAFVITTIIIALIITIVANLPYLFSLFNKDDGPARIGYAAAEQGEQAAGTALALQLKAYYEAQPEPELLLVEFPAGATLEESEAAMKKGISSEEIKGYITFGSADEGQFPAVTYKSEKIMDNSTAQKLKTALQAIKTDTVLKNAGLTEEEKTLLYAPVAVDSVQISSSAGGKDSNGKTAAQQGMDMALIYVMVIMLFMAIMVTGQMIASEITAEKSSRVMEILITSVSPLKQMFGKILGMFLVGLSQMAIYVIVIVINVMLPQNVDILADMDIRLSEIDPGLLAYAVVFFLTGYFLFATLFAAVGSIVSRTEDLGQAVIPITMTSLAGFYIAIFSLSNPDSMLVHVTSFIPFFSPYVMLLRLGLSDPPLWEVWTSIGLLLIAIYVCGVLAAKIYRTGVLMYGKRPTIKELRRAMRAYK
ncbi:ABC transporter permease [Paenibacillus sp. GCM10023252]|uniref:ABC transporter permease n=1 Tax=Paenibacillus sp. GCM10023252 TaxID=3252649 RepID=UPI00362310BC